MKVWEKGVDGVSAVSQWQLLILCGTVVCNFNVIHPQRGNTKGWGCSNSFFYSFHSASKQARRVLQEPCSNFLFKLNMRLKITFLRPPPPSCFGIHYSGIFSKATSGNNCDCALWHTQMSLGELVWAKVKWIWKTVSSKTSMSLSVLVDHHRWETGLKGNVSRENIKQNIFVASW